MLLVFCNTVLYGQISRQDSVAIEKLLKSDKPLILNQELVKSIKFEGELFERTPDQLTNSASYLIPDLSLPGLVVEKNGRLTLRPYTIHLKPYEDPIYGLPPPILMNTEPGPGGGRPTVSSGVGVVVMFDAESMLRRIFWKSERAKRKNAKRVQAHKYY